MRRNPACSRSHLPIKEATIIGNSQHKYERYFVFGNTVRAIDRTWDRGSSCFVAMSAKMVGRGEFAVGATDQPWWEMLLIMTTCALPPTATYAWDWSESKRMLSPFSSTVGS